MSQILESTHCCGLDEIEALQSTPEDTLRLVCSDKYTDSHYDYSSLDYENGRKQAFILFTDAVKFGNGVELAKYIRKHKLGVVYETTRARTNPNSENPIKAWIWGPSEVALRKWYQSNTDY